MPRFISELDPSNPDDAEELRRHVYGHNYRTDAEGNPIVQGLGSVAHLRSGQGLGSVESHFRAIGKYEGADAEAKARKEFADNHAKIAEKNKAKLAASKVPREVEEAY